MATIYEFRTPIPVHTEHGDGTAILIIDYGLDVNTIWVVRLSKTGKVLHYYSEDIRIYGNPMGGNDWDIELPETWKK